MRRCVAASIGIAMLAAPACADDRRVAVDPNQPPWNAVAKVQTNTGTHCSGALIAPATVLTAAHCLYNRRTGALLQPLSLHVLLGYERAHYRWHRLVTRFTVGSGFDGRRGPQTADWARLELAEPVPVTPLKLTDTPPVAGMAVALAGYNQDRAQLLMADLACHVLRLAAPPAGDAGAFLTHDCEGTHGTSGAPLLARQHDRWAVAAIAIAAGRAENLALLPPLADLR